MSNEKLLRDLHRLRDILIFVLGVSVTLLIIMAAGDTSKVLYTFPSGWFALWLIVTLGSIPLGIVLLVGPTWRSIPLSERRGEAMGFLIVGLINLFSLTLYFLQWSSFYPAFVCPVGYAVLLSAVYVRVYGREQRGQEDLFP